jgi:hypothetical protein
MAKEPTHYGGEPVSDPRNKYLPETYHAYNRYFGSKKIKPSYIDKEASYTRREAVKMAGGKVKRNPHHKALEKAKS